MLDILKNFDAAEKGEKPAGPAEVGSMKAILEGFHNASVGNTINESETAVEECGGMPMQAQMAAPQEQGNPVTMNVSINASGKDNVDDLIRLMKAVSGAEQHVDTEPRGQAMDMAAMRAAIMGPEEDMEEWANSPEGSEDEEEYKDLDYMTKDIAGGLNREKPKGAERAKDPAVRQHVESIKDQLWAALTEKKEVQKKRQ